jgi:putative nucleotidyltransferase with HDIG domain
MGEKVLGAFNGVDGGNIIDEISDKKLRKLLEGYLLSLPDQLSELGASSSGKYHSTIENGPGGLFRHCRVVCGVIRTIAEAMGQSLDSEKVAAIIHDLGKYGVDATQKHTIADHPIVGAQMFREYCSKKRLDDETKEKVVKICKMVECHSGRWNTNKYIPGLVMPTPVTMEQHILHWADMIASRFDFSASFDEHGTLKGELPF